MENNRYQQSVDEQNNILARVHEFNDQQRSVLSKEGTLLRFENGKHFNLPVNSTRPTLFWVIQGAVLLERNLADGKAMFSILKESMAFPASVGPKDEQGGVMVSYAVGPVTLLAIPFATFQRLCQTDGNFAWTVISSLHQENCLQSDLLKLSMAGAIPERIKNILIYFGHECGQIQATGGVALPRVLTYRVIAYFAKTTAQTVAKTIKNLRTIGLLLPLNHKLVFSAAALDKL
ncbi:MAG TPA: Crp/Fnr family transcriptional regulator [Candidatus Ligilactobacillus excrementipullorum]|nr:Crp/Fnr family transcriptional regulator [Candidatus Ligilactobacillus excrementipullorum]